MARMERAVPGRNGELCGVDLFCSGAYPGSRQWFWRPGWRARFLSAWPPWLLSRKCRQSAACPAQSFSAFVDAFAENAAIQRRYTRIPFEYGHLDQELIGTPRQDEAFSTRTVNSFDAIPLFDRKDDGRIFPSKKKRLKQRLEIRMNADDVERHANHIIATVGIPDTGFRLQDRFAKNDNCWMLVVVDDRSI